MSLEMHRDKCVFYRDGMCHFLTSAPDACTTVCINFISFRRELMTLFGTKGKPVTYHAMVKHFKLTPAPAQGDYVQQTIF